MMKTLNKIMKPLMPEIEREWSLRLVNALLGAILFVLLGSIIPSVYYRYFDKTVYYKIYSFETTNASYTQCDSSNVLIKRESKVNATAKRFVDIVLQTEDGDINIPLHELDDTLIIEESKSKTIQTSFPIPCDLQNGEYRWLLRIGYTVNGVEKYEIAKSNPFLVSSEL